MSHQTAKRPHGPSAYMIFSEEQRPKLMEKLRAEAADGKVPITVVAKALGEAWKALPQEDKASYQCKAKERAASAAAAAADDQDLCQEQQQGEDAHAATKPSAAGAATGPSALPRHVVKRIIMTDADVQRVSADAVWLLAETARLFLEHLAVKAAAAAASKKRKTVKLEDFAHVVRCDKRLVEAGLKEVASSKNLFEKHGAPAAAAAAAAVAVAGSSGKQQRAKDQAVVEADGQPGAEGDGTLTDEQLIAQEEEKRQKAAEAAKVRAAKSAERKKAKQIAEAASTHKITTFFVSNKPDTLVSV